MKKNILFLGFLLVVSCTNNINDKCVTKDLSESEQLILAQTDSVVYKHVIVIDDEVLIFDDPAKDIIKITSYDIGIVFFISFALGAFLTLFLWIIIDR